MKKFTYTVGNRHDVPVQPATAGQHKKLFELEECRVIHQSNLQSFLESAPHGFANFEQIARILERPHPKGCVGHWLVTQLGYLTGQVSGIPLELCITDTVVIERDGERDYTVAWYDHPIFPTCAQSRDGWPDFEDGRTACQEIESCLFAKQQIGIAGKPRCVKVHYVSCLEHKRRLPRVGQMKKEEGGTWLQRFGEDENTCQLIRVTVPASEGDSPTMAKHTMEALQGIRLNFQRIFRYKVWAGGFVDP